MFSLKWALTLAGFGALVSGGAHFAGITYDDKIELMTQIAVGAVIGALIPLAMFVAAIMNIAAQIVTPVVTLVPYVIFTAICSGWKPIAYPLFRGVSYAIPPNRKFMVAHSSLRRDGAVAALAATGGTALAYSLHDEATNPLLAKTIVDELNLEGSAAATMFSVGLNDLNTLAISPSTGLPMKGGMNGGVDVGGHVFGETPQPDFMDATSINQQ